MLNAILSLAVLVMLDAPDNQDDTGEGYVSGGCQDDLASALPRSAGFKVIRS